MKLFHQWQIGLHNRDKHTCTNGSYGKVKIFLVTYVRLPRQIARNLIGQDLDNQAMPPWCDMYETEVI